MMLPCQMTLVVRKPGTFLLLRGIGKTCCVADQVCRARLHAGHGTERERGLAQCFAGFVSWDISGLREF